MGYFLFKKLSEASDGEESVMKPLAWRPSSTAKRDEQPTGAAICWLKFTTALALILFEVYGTVALLAGNDCTYRCNYRFCCISSVFVKFKHKLQLFLRLILSDTHSRIKKHLLN